MTRLFVCICYDYISGLAGICMCIMMTFVCAKDSSIKPVQIQNKYAEKNKKLLKLAVASAEKLAVARTGEARYSY